MASLHQIPQHVRDTVHNYPTDSGTKAGVLHIYAHSGQLKSMQDVRSLSEQEQEWFHLGFEEYLKDHDHPVRKTHAPVHYGRVVYYVSLIYYLSIIIWLGSLLKISSERGQAVHWSSVWGWIAFVSVFNIVITIYGIYLELKAHHGQLSRLHRFMAALALIVLVIAIMGNMVTPFSGSADVNSMFLVNPEL